METSLSNPATRLSKQVISGLSKQLGCLSKGIRIYQSKYVVCPSGRKKIIKAARLTKQAARLTNQAARLTNQPTGLSKPVMSGSSEQLGCLSEEIRVYQSY